MNPRNPLGGCSLAVPIDEPPLVIRDFVDSNVPNMNDLMQNVYSVITASTGSRYVVYRSVMNPRFEIHSLYKERHTINDRFRISFTRFRVSGHSLCVETGRWNRRGRGRLPLEERLCACGETERHVVEVCPVSSDIRQAFDIPC